VLHCPSTSIKRRIDPHMNEEFEKRWERKVEFILNQQAQLDAESIKLKAAQAETEKALTRLTDIVSSLTTVTFEGFKVLLETQRRTEEELQKLMGRVNRHLSEDHGLEN
jgi:Uri superfamily endonuclease